ncbi:THOC1 protein, partial [Tricholaema leucomelas]|nr:THOC1 protein [Tricholaema leucomelas]
IFTFQDISKAVKHSNKKFIKIDKPPVCQKLLQSGKRYRLMCEPEAEVTPEEFEFVDGSHFKLKNYIEVYLEKPDDFTLSLVELESEATVWKAKLRESDWIHYDLNKNKQRKSTVSKRVMLSLIWFGCFFPRCVFSDGTKTKTLTDQQLMVIAQKFGRQWKEIAIECLQMEMKDIEQIQATEEGMNMQIFLVLSKWRDREQSKGTAEALYASLREKASCEILQTLQGVASV